MESATMRLRSRLRTLRVRITGVAVIVAVVGIHCGTQPRTSKDSGLEVAAAGPPPERSFLDCDPDALATPLPARIVRKELVICGTSASAAHAVLPHVMRVLADLEVETGLTPPPGIVYLLDATFASNEHRYWLPRFDGTWEPIAPGGNRTIRKWCGGVESPYFRESFVLERDDPRTESLVPECAREIARWVAVVAGEESHRVDFASWLETAREKVLAPTPNHRPDLAERLYWLSLEPWVILTAREYRTLDSRLLELQRRETLFVGVLGAMPVAAARREQLMREERQRITAWWNPIFESRPSPFPP